MVFDINWLGVTLAAAASLLLAALWYSPVLFGNTWRIWTNRGDTGQDRSSHIKRLVLIIPATFVSATLFGALLGSMALGYAMMTGFAAGLFWVATGIGVSYALEPRPFALWAVNGGFHVLQFTLYGLCIGLANTYL